MPDRPHLPMRPTLDLCSHIAKLLLKRAKKIYYRAIETTAGHHKRDILITRVQHAQTSLDDAKEQFESTLEKFSALTSFHGGTLEDTYTALRFELEHSESKATAVKEQIRAVQDIAEALFLEWEQELLQYSNRTLRSASRAKLRTTQQHYKQLMSAFKHAEGKIDPVLAAFRDQVLFLKHNLNAAAIASLQNELVNVGLDIATLIRSMETSIHRAQSFVDALAPAKSLPPPT